MIDDFYTTETVKFTTTQKIEGSVVDITADTVTAYVKTEKDEPLSAAIITSVGDVTTQGANGIAQITFTCSQTDVSPGTYYLQIYWQPSTGECYYSDIQRFKIISKI